jgi:hypothetical protein
VWPKVTFDSIYSLYKLYFSFKFCEVTEDIVFYVKKCTMNFSSLCFIRSYCISSVNLLLNFLSYLNSGKRLIYFSNITYDVLYTKVDTKTQLIRGKTKITNHVKW